MLTHIKTKGVITDLMGQKDQQNLENPMIYGIFLLADKFFPKILVQFFPNLKPLYLGQILTFWALVFCKHLHFYSRIGLCNKKVGL